MDIVTKLGFPLCQKTRVPIKTLVEQLGGITRDKKIIESHASSINLISLLNEQTIRIRAYKDDNYSFQVIYVLEIILKNNDQMTDFTELVHSAFPESTLLVLIFKGKKYISGALKRINKNDHSKTVIEDSIWAEVFDDFSFNVPSMTNLKDYYEFLVRLIYRIKVKNITGLFPNVDRDYKELIKKYEQLSSQVKKLSDDYTAASMINEKMRIDNQLYEKEEEIRELKALISGGN